MRNETITYKTDIHRFDRKKDSWVKMKDYDIVTSFKFSGNEFVLLYKGGVFFVGVEVKGNVMSLYYVRENDDGKKVLPGEVVSMFRKLYIKNGITQEVLDGFLKDPVGYCDAKNK